MSYTTGSHTFFTTATTSFGSRSIATKCWKAHCETGYERLSDKSAKNSACRSCPAYCPKSMSICSWKFRRISPSATSCDGSKDDRLIACKWSFLTYASGTGDAISGLGATSAPPAATLPTTSYFSICVIMNLPASAGSYSVSTASRPTHSRCASRPDHHGRRRTARSTCGGKSRGDVETGDLSGKLIVQLGVVTEPVNRIWHEREPGKDCPARVASGGALQAFLRSRR